MNSDSTTTTLTEKESSTMISAACAVIGATSGEFGFFNEMKMPANVKNQKGLGSLFGSLLSKDLIWIDAERQINGEPLNDTQFGFTPAGASMLNTIDDAAMLIGSFAVYGGSRLDGERCINKIIDCAHL